MGRRRGYAITRESVHSKVDLQSATHPLENTTKMPKESQRSFNFWKCFGNYSKELPFLVSNNVTLPNTDINQCALVSMELSRHNCESLSEILSKMSDHKDQHATLPFVASTLTLNALLLNLYKAVIVVTDQ